MLSRTEITYIVSIYYYCVCVAHLLSIHSWSPFSLFTGLWNKDHRNWDQLYLWFLSLFLLRGQLSNVYITNITFFSVIKVCQAGECKGSICLKYGMDQCFLSSSHQGYTTRKNTWNLIFPTSYVTSTRRLSCSRNLKTIPNNKPDDVAVVILLPVELI